MLYFAETCPAFPENVRVDEDPAMAKGVCDMIARVQMLISTNCLTQELFEKTILRTEYVCLFHTCTCRFIKMLSKH